MIIKSATFLGTVAACAAGVWIAHTRSAASNLKPAPEPGVAQKAPEAAEIQDFFDDSVELPARYAAWDIGKERMRGTNFDRIPVNKNNYRSARVPEDDPEFFSMMQKRYGIRAILNVRERDYDEGKSVRAAGLEYITIPLTDKPPKPEDWEKIKKEFKKGGVLVHCTHGADRSGAVVARYRVEELGMPLDEAYDDALSYGFKTWSSNRFLKCFIENGPADQCYQ
jgi:protein tyrosine phosphatase (PTP) superfamily phosphohydrolase (DUF442 family)